MEPGPCIWMNHDVLLACYVVAVEYVVVELVD